MSRKLFALTNLLLVLLILALLVSQQKYPNSVSFRDMSLKISSKKNASSTSMTYHHSPGNDSTARLEEPSPKPSPALSPKTLSSEVLHGIEKLAFFVGYARSGHSIVGTLMDAHPHVVISNEFGFFKKFSLLNRASDEQWTANFYNLLYSHSKSDAVRGLRVSKAKGYVLKVDGMWQGKFDRYIKVIGDKDGPATLNSYIDNRESFLKNYEKLKSNVDIPLRIIHVVRNPFDIISTIIIWKYRSGSFREVKKQFIAPQTGRTTKKDLHKFNNSKTVDTYTKRVFEKIDAAQKLINEVFGRENVLDVHNRDLVSDPRGTVSRLFEFLEVEVTEHYLDACEGKVFKSVSRSRNTVVWTPEQVEEVERRMKEYHMLRGYSFTSD